MKNQESEQRFDHPPRASVETSARWVRVKIGRETVAESKQPLLLIQFGPGILPTYFFPAGAVDMDFLSNPHEIRNRRFWDILFNGEQVNKGAWEFINPKNELADLAGHITFTWNDNRVIWLEEEVELFAHARDPYKRVDALPSSRHVQVLVNGTVVADTHRPTLLFETHLPVRYYIPREDVRMEFLEPSSHQSLCPYKGQANYWSLVVGDTTLNDVVWSYPDPIPENPRIKGLFCFYNEKVDLIVDGEKQSRPVTPWS